MHENLGNIISYTYIQIITLFLEAAQCTEAVYMQWLRKATGHFRAVAEDRICDEEVRITYESSFYTLFASGEAPHVSCIL